MISSEDNTKSKRIGGADAFLLWHFYAEVGQIAVNLLHILCLEGFKHICIGVQRNLDVAVSEQFCSRLVGKYIQRARCFTVTISPDSKSKKLQGVEAPFSNGAARDILIDCTADNLGCTFLLHYAIMNTTNRELWR